jgi:hypothetical protein
MYAYYNTGSSGSGSGGGSGGGTLLGSQSSLPPSHLSHIQPPLTPTPAEAGAGAGRERMSLGADASSCQLTFRCLTREVDILVKAVWDVQCAWRARQARRALQAKALVAYEKVWCGG